MYNFILKTQPKSFNSWHKTATPGIKYAEDVKNAFKRYNKKAILLNEDLYGIVYYFCKKSTKTDADNISKPIWDVLIPITYIDDKQIKLRIAGIFDLNTQDFNDLNLAKLSNKIATDLTEAITDQKCEHILYIEIGILEHSHYPFTIS